MKKTKTHSGFYLIWIPLMALLLSSTACNQNQKTSSSEEQNGIIQNEETVNPGEVDELPEMKGGMQALMTYMTDHIIYPESLRSEGVEAKVLVQFTVSSTGSIVDVTALPGKETVDQAFIDEAVKAVSKMPVWTPGIKDGKPVSVRMVLPVTFKLK